MKMRQKKKKYKGMTILSTRSANYTIREEVTTRSAASGVQVFRFVARG